MNDEHIAFVEHEFGARDEWRYTGGMLWDAMPIDIAKAVLGLILSTPIGLFPVLSAKAQATATLAPVHAVILEGSGWEESDVRTHYETMAAVMSTCGIRLGELTVDRVAAPREFEHIAIAESATSHRNDDALVNFFAAVPRPAVFYVRAIEPDPGVAIAHPLDDGYTQPMVNTVFMGYVAMHRPGNMAMYGALMDGLLAHEVTHLLTNGSHFDDEPNILGDPLYGNMALRLTAAQCMHAIASQLVQPR
jgi:hypothetical protein